jgi:hypothetical protein
MNTVSLDRNSTRTVARVAGLLVLAALAIAFFALPMASYAMGCKGGKGGKKGGAAATTKIAGHVTFLALLQENSATKNTTAPNTEQMVTIPAAKVTSLMQWDWIKADSNGTEVYVTLTDTKGHGWTADTTNSGNGNVYVMVDGINVPIIAAPKNGTLP